jgi:predicted Zn-ribbon and HTH transcriptional regulator
MLRVPRMEDEDWRKKLKEVLMRFDFPIGIDDVRRLVDVPGDDMPLLYEEIARITKSLAGTPYTLVVEEGKCSSCFRSVGFSRKMIIQCPSCGGYVSPPKVCINPR